jgi:hypothetical protein
VSVSHDLLDVGIIAPHAGKSRKGLFASTGHSGHSGRPGTKNG